MRVLAGMCPDCARDFPFVYHYELLITDRLKGVENIIDLLSSVLFDKMAISLYGKGAYPVQIFRNWSLWCYTRGTQWCPNLRKEEQLLMEIALQINIFVRIRVRFNRLRKQLVRWIQRTLIT